MNHTPSNMEFVAEVAAHVRSYCRDELSCACVNRLFTIAARIAQQRLLGRLRAAAHIHDTTIEQQALSVVAPLFSYAGSDSHLADALSEHLASDDVTVFQRFQAVVVLSTEDASLQEASHFED